MPPCHDDAEKQLHECISYSPGSAVGKEGTDEAQDHTSQIKEYRRLREGSWKTLTTQNHAEASEKMLFCLCVYRTVSILSRASQGAVALVAT